MAKNLQWIEVVGELIKLTLKNQLVWKVGEPLRSIGKESDERIESVFYTTYQGKKLRLYKRIYKAYRHRDEVTYAPIYEPFLVSEVVLEIVDDNGLTLWRFPTLDITLDLLSSVQYRVSGAQELLEHVLKRKMSQV